MVRKIISILLGFVLLGAAVADFDFNLGGFNTELSFKSGVAVTGVSNQVLARTLGLVCPGPGYVEGGATAGAAVFSPAGAADLAVNQNSAANFLSAQQPTLVQVPAEQATLPQGSSLLSANQTQFISSPAQGISAGVNGLIGADCQRPSSDFWFLGASTAVGRQSLLIVNNPSPVDATFSLELYDEGGLVTASGLEGLSVAASKTLVLPLASFAPSDPTLAIHMTSQGGAVAAWIQQKTVRGTVAAGVDFISPASSAASIQVMPGLSVIGSKSAAEIAQSNPDYADLSPMVRLFVPQSTAGSAKTLSVTVLVSGIDAKTFGTVVQQDVNVGQTTDIPVSGLGDGRYSVEVTAAKPLFAALKMSVNSTDPARVLAATGSDFAWVGAAEPITSQRNVMVPTQGASSLNITNANTTAATVSLRDMSDAKIETLVVPANGQLDVPVRAGANLQISAQSEIFANLTTHRENGIAAFKILDSKNLGGLVEVSLR